MKSSPVGSPWDPQNTAPFFHAQLQSRGTLNKDYKDQNTTFIAMGPGWRIQFESVS